MSFLENDGKLANKKVMTLRKIQISSYSDCMIQLCYKKRLNILSHLYKNFFDYKMFQITCYSRAGYVFRQSVSTFYSHQWICYFYVYIKCVYF